MISYSDILKKIDRKLIAPMRRRHKDPKIIARAMMVGLGSAFFPFFGQMPIVFAIWFVSRKLRWRFSLIVALAWTWASNTLTNLPIFYGFYKMGEFLRGAEETLSYAQIKKMGVLNLIKELSLTVSIGSIPFIVFFSVIGYWIGYFFSKKIYNNSSENQ